jgi:hypothetical protein
MELAKIKGAILAGHDTDRPTAMGGACGGLAGAFKERGK